MSTKRTKAKRQIEKEKGKGSFAITQVYVSDLIDPAPWFLANDSRLCNNYLVDRVIVFLVWDPSFC